MRNIVYITALLTLIGPATAAAQTTFTVNTTDDVDDATCDASHCSLREAINAANQAAGTDTIAFDIAGAGVRFIRPASALPTISAPIYMDGTTQPGYAGDPLISLQSRLSPTPDGLTITGGNSTIRALSFDLFANSIVLDVAGGNVLVGNTITSSETGIAVRSPNNTIGGESLDNANEIVLGSGDGILITSAGNTVRGNFVGLEEGDDPDNLGATDNGNGRNGIRIENGANNTIGGTGLRQGNVIVRSDSAGVYIDGASATDNRLVGNTIAHNGLEGIVLPASGAGNEIESNSLFENGGLGIDLEADGVTDNDTGDGDTGPNNLQNYPELNRARLGGAAFIDGVLRSSPNTDLNVELFSSETCDASDNGEGKVFLTRATLTTDSNGESDIELIANDVDPGSYITATATAPDGSTSEFSSCTQASGFTITIIPDTTVVGRGSTASYAVEINPLGGPYNTEVDLRCTELPAFSSCTFSQDTLIPGANGVTSFLSIATRTSSIFGLAPVSGTGAFDASAWPGRIAMVLFVVAVVLVVVAGRDRRRRRLALPFAAAMLLAGVVLQTGCDDDGTGPNGPNGGVTPSGVYEIVVRARSEPIIHFGTTTLVVGL